MFRIGQKVVCIDAEGAEELKLNGVYTIKSCDSRLSDWRGMRRQWCGVLLYEANPNPAYGSFCGERFRPVDERKTDISIFKKMLNPQKNRADA